MAESDTRGELAHHDVPAGLGARRMTALCGLVESQSESGESQSEVLKI